MTWKVDDKSKELSKLSSDRLRVITDIEALYLFYDKQYSLHAGFREQFAKIVKKFERLYL